MGAVGSFHCVGMCGPIAMTLPQVNDSDASRFTSTLLYNAGRAITYAILGAILGTIGYSFFLLGLQKFLTIGTGVGMMIFLFMPGKVRSGGSRMQWLMPLRNKIGSLYSKPHYSSVFTIGLLNGLLPCGLVYAALAVAVAGGSVMSGLLFMAAFGLGTLPMMWAVAFFSLSIKAGFRAKIRKLYPYVVFVMAGILIMRGLNLGIPFLSPSIHEKHLYGTGINCHD